MVVTMGTNNAQILDIGGSRLNESLRDMLASRLLTPGNQCVLPSALLSDDNGSMLWQQINRFPEYYQTREEISLLEAHGNDIADLIAPNTVLVDIGCGDTRKVFPLLSLLDQKQKPIHYYGLDLSLEALRSNISTLAASFKHVQCHGLWGTFDDARRYAPTLSPASPRWFLSLGSILGNDFPTPAVSILSSWASILRPVDRILLGMDATQSPARIWRSYHDPAGLFERFMRGGLAHSNRVLGHAWYRPEDWEVAGAMWEGEHVMHRFVFRARTHVRCEAVGLDFLPGHEIDCYEAFKYGPGEMARQFEAAGLRQLRVWRAPEPSSIYEYLLVNEPSLMVEDDQDAALTQA